MRRGNLSAIYLFLFLFLFACTNTQPTLSRLPDDAVILAFGDSLTSGVGALPGSSYPKFLKVLLKE